MFLFFSSIIGSRIYRLVLELWSWSCGGCMLRNCRCCSTFRKDELKSSSMFSMEEGRKFRHSWRDKKKIESWNARKKKYPLYYSAWVKLSGPAQKQGAFFGMDEPSPKYVQESAKQNIGFNRPNSACWMGWVSRKLETKSWSS
jgi:hypothetical protein